MARHQQNRCGRIAKQRRIRRHQYPSRRGRQQRRVAARTGSSRISQNARQPVRPWWRRRRSALHVVPEYRSAKENRRQACGGRNRSGERRDGQQRMKISSIMDQLRHLPEKRLAGVATRRLISSRKAQQQAVAKVSKPLSACVSSGMGVIERLELGAGQTIWRDERTAAHRTSLPSLGDRHARKADGGARKGDAGGNVAKDV